MKYTIGITLIGFIAFAVMLPIHPSFAQSTEEICFEREEAIRTLQADAKLLAANLDRTVERLRENGDSAGAAAAIVKARAAATAVDDALFSYASECEDVLANPKLEANDEFGIKSKISVLTAAVNSPDPFDKLKNLKRTYELRAYERALAAIEAEKAAAEDETLDIGTSADGSLTIRELFLPLGQIIYPDLITDKIKEERREEGVDAKELELPLDEDLNRIEGTQGKPQRDSFEQLLEEEVEEEPGFFGKLTAWIASLFKNTTPKNINEQSEAEPEAEAETAETTAANTTCSLPATLINQLYPPDVYTKIEDENSVTFTRTSCRSKSAAAFREEAEAYNLGQIQNSCPGARISDVAFTASGEPCGVTYSW